MAEILSSDQKPIVKSRSKRKGFALNSRGELVSLGMGEIIC